VSTPRHRSVLVEAARLYYLEGLDQAAAARRMGMTRSNFSRVLKAAREAGVIEFRINEAFAREQELEEDLAQALGLARAIVSDSESIDLGSPARLAAGVLAQGLSGARTVAISWGSTIQAVIAALPPMHYPQLQVVQLVGGLTSFDSRVSAHDLVQELAGRLDARYLYLNCPAVFDSPDALRTMQAESSVRDTLELARRADVALVGIGNPSQGSSAALLGLLVPDASERDRVREAGVVGDVCGRYYDLEGRMAELPGITDRVLAIDAEALRRIPNTIGVAVGAHKAAAVVGAARAGLVKTLVCDAALARAALARARERPRPHPAGRRRQASAVHSAGASARRRARPDT